MKVSEWPPTVPTLSDDKADQLNVMAQYMQKQLEEMAGMVETLTLSTLEEEEYFHGR